MREELIKDEFMSLQAIEGNAVSFLIKIAPCKISAIEPSSQMKLTPQMQSINTISVSPLCSPSSP